jgi:two-component system osmolarity sensor histidine kinase EnvZ
MAIAVETPPTKARRPAVWRKFTSLLAELLPKGLYARTLIIIMAPIFLVECIVTFVFMEQHWEQVTRRLSEATAHEVAALIDIYQNYPQDEDHRRLTELASKRLGLTLEILPAGELPPMQPRPFFDLLDRALTLELKKSVSQPFWIDTVGNSQHVEMRISLQTGIMRVLVRRSQAYASNWHIVLVWMVGTSLVLYTTAIVILRNQIRPILKLGEAAEAFGKGRQGPPDFKPRGAREVRQAAAAFIEMRDRIERHVDQRTTMLAGVSHDLRTVLTRFKLQLALLDDNAAIKGLERDADEMRHMLEDYLAFAKGDGGEVATPTNVVEILEEIREDAERSGKAVDLTIKGKATTIEVPLKRQAFKRAVMNLVNNAVRYGEEVVITCRTDRRWLRIEVDDDGPGVPADKREAVFRPFYRLDKARNFDKGNSGLGLSIARDIARSHGGDIWIEESKMGGVRAVARVPL